MLKDLQKNEKFRKILKKQQIGWRLFVAYCQFGLPDENGKMVICLGKYRGIYDYLVCYCIIKHVSYHESIIVDIIEA